MIYLKMGDLYCYRAGQDLSLIDSSKKRIQCLESTGQITESLGEENANVSVVLTLNDHLRRLLKDPPLTAILYDDDALIFEGSIDSVDAGKNVKVTIAA